MSSYGPLADFYDSLTEDVDYQSLYEYLMAICRRNGVKPEVVLDMACGTGSLSFLFTQNGSRCYGMDLSLDMLARARDKAAQLERAPLFSQGDMADFSAPEPVDLLVCMLDSFNYMTSPEKGKQAIASFARAVRPGGLLIFDIRPPEQLQAFDGQMFMDETEDVACIWRTEFDKKKNQCFYGMDIFVREGELWRREQEEHVEYAFSLEFLKQELESAGFRQVTFYGERTLMPPEPDEERIFITARKDETP